MRVALLCLIAACAGASPYRDIEGRPVSTTARLDADVAPVVVRCDGRSYAIVTAPRPYLGTHVGTHRPFVRDARVMCAKIRAAGV